MKDSLIFFLFLILIVLIFALKASIIIKENHRVVVLRLGRHKATLGPGLVFIIPFIDQPISVNLTKHVPEWRSLDNMEIIERVENLVLNDPNLNKYH